VIDGADRQEKDGGENFAAVLLDRIVQGRDGAIRIIADAVFGERRR
jgi:hypothetical protein